VIALKLFNFTRQAGEDPRKVFRLGLTFCGGVFAFFLGLALAVIGLQRAGSSLNWGFQFQNPWILLGLLGAVFVFGLNLLGVFEITLSSGASQRLSELSAREGHGGAFVHGAFTTLLGTSCTAPYLGVTLGFAASQPAPKVIAIFLTIAAGMSLPYLILTANPALLRLLPKPGVWMERLKQFMGFIILAVAVWLLGVLGDTRGVAAVQGASALLLALGMGCWLIGTLRTRAWALVWSVLLCGAALWFFVWPALREDNSRNQTAVTSPNREAEIWEPFSPERLESELQKGTPVFVDFTASWCLNCKVNEKVTLSRQDVLTAFRNKGVVLLKADWSDGDPVITAELRKHERVGVPLYVLHAPHQAPVRFPEILKPQTLLDALQPLPDARR
jgi:thiol:disulfide interchange protein DsbD